MSTMNQAMNYLADRVPNIGDLYRASWTKSGASAGDGTNCTNAITIPEGVYIITVRAPVCSGWTTLKVTNIPNFYPYLNSAGTATIITRFTSSVSLRVQMAQSASVTYSYVERGGLEAVRVRVV